MITISVSVIISTFFCLQFRIILSRCLSNLWICCCLHVSSFRLCMTGCDGGNGAVVWRSNSSITWHNCTVLSWHLWTVHYRLLGVCTGEAESVFYHLISIKIIFPHCKNLVYWSTESFMMLCHALSFWENEKIFSHCRKFSVLVRHWTFPLSSNVLRLGLNIELICPPIHTRPRRSVWLGTSM